MTRYMMAGFFFLPR